MLNSKSSWSRAVSLLLVTAMLASCKPTIVPDSQSNSIHVKSGDKHVYMLTHPVDLGEDPTNSLANASMNQTILGLLGSQGECGYTVVSDKPFNLRDDVQLAEALSLAKPINARPVRKSMIWSLAQRNADLQEVYRLETNGALNLAAAVTVGVPTAATASFLGAGFLGSLAVRNGNNVNSFLFSNIQSSFLKVTEFITKNARIPKAGAGAYYHGKAVAKKMETVCRANMLKVCAVGVAVAAVAVTAGAMFVGNQLSEKAQQTFSDPTRLKAMEAALTEIDSLRTVHESNARGVKTYIAMLQEFDRASAAAMASTVATPCPSPSDVLAETRNMNQN